MYNIISIFNSELPVFKLFELYTQYDEHFDEKTKSKTRNTYIILLLVFKILIWVYAFYLLYKCLSQRSTSGEYVNSVCEIVVMVCCLPCWLIYRTFINRCTTVIPSVNLYESNPVLEETQQQVQPPIPSPPPPPPSSPPPQQVQQSSQVQQTSPPPQPEPLQPEPLQSQPTSTPIQPPSPQSMQPQSTPPISNDVSEVVPMLNTTVQESEQMPTPTEVTTNMPTTGGKKRGRPAKVVKSKKVNL
jgi:hypothetical protein